MQTTLNFERDRQLEIPFPQSPSRNQELLERAKDLARNMNASPAERRDAQADLERLKQTRLDPRA